MAHVTSHCAELESRAAAAAVAAELEAFVAAFAAYEERALRDRIALTDPAPPLVELAAKHGFTLPGACKILVKGLAREEMTVLQIDRLVFFYAGGFELGGRGIEAYFALMKARRYSRDTAHLVVASSKPEAAARELGTFLDEEDFEGQYSLVHTDPRPRNALFSVRFEHGDEAWTLCFDDSGVQDWAFIECLPQLDSDAPRLDAPAPSSDPAR